MADKSCLAEAFVEAPIKDPVLACVVSLRDRLPTCDVKKLIFDYRLFLYLPRILCCYRQRCSSQGLAQSLLKTLLGFCPVIERTVCSRLVLPACWAVNSCMSCLCFKNPFRCSCIGRYAHSTVMYSLYLRERIIRLVKSLHGNQLVKVLREEGFRVRQEWSVLRIEEILKKWYTI